MFAKYQSKSWPAQDFILHWTQDGTVLNLETKASPLFSVLYSHSNAAAMWHIILQIDHDCEKLKVCER